MNKIKVWRIKCETQIEWQRSMPETSVIQFADKDLQWTLFLDPEKFPLTVVSFTNELEYQNTERGKLFYKADTKKETRYKKVNTWILHLQSAKKKLSVKFHL